MSEIVLYLHIVGAVTLFSGLIAAAVAMLRMERAEGETRRELASMARAMASMATGGGGLALIFGLYLILSGDGHSFGEAWVDNSLGLLLVMIAVIPMVIVPRLRAIADGGGTMGDPTLWITTTAMLGAAFGIEYLMVVKPMAHGADDGVLLLFLLLGAGAGWLRTREA
ncbi:MAG: DUF2269 family protein [Candidatus Thermoplasmatota archaeon]|nr:DUF2269 family protein [Candidatus Thermoplasmatota archaeon]